MHRRHGVTLLELMCVLAVIGALVATASVSVAPRLVTSVRSDVEIHRLGTALRLARARAIASRRNVDVRFRRSQALTESYTVQEQRTRVPMVSHDMPEDVSLYASTTRLVFDAEGRPNRTAYCLVYTRRRWKWLAVDATTGVVHISDSRPLR